MKLRFMSIALVSILLLAIVGCAPAATPTPAATPAPGAAPALPEGDIFLTIGTASVGGAFYPIGMELARIWNSTIPRSRAIAQATAGSAQNLLLLSSAELQVAVLRGQQVYEFAQDGTYTEGRALFPLYYTGLEMLVRVGSGIESVPDLAGRRVAVGPIGSGGHADVISTLAAFGMTTDDLRPEFIEASQAVQMLGDGLLDAAFLGLSEGAAATSELLLGGRVVLHSFSDEEVQALLNANPNFTAHTIPANIYPNQDYPISTVAALPIFIGVDASLNEELVYQMVKNFYENIDSFRESHHSVSGWDSGLIRLNTHIPYHPGAERFWREVGHLD